MALTANPAAGVTREELDSVIEALEVRIAALEAAWNSRRGDANVVRRGEFRILKWQATFALAVVLGGLGILYEEIGDIRDAMERLRTDLIREIRGLRSEVQAEHSGLRGEVTGVQERWSIAGPRHSLANMRRAVRPGYANDL